MCAEMGGSWLMDWPAPPAVPVLLCVPPAGAGCGRFRSWQQGLAGVAQVIGVQPPGRENRWLDPMPGSVAEAVAELSAQVAECVGPTRPVVVFGHSFGGLLGYELARTLRAERTARVTALVVSACRPPAHWHGAGRGIAEDEAALGRLFDTGGPDVAALDPDTRALLLEVLRRDARLSLGYRHAATPVLDVPIHAWGGDGDDTVTPEQLDGWPHYSELACHRRQFPGGHHFALRTPELVLPLLAELLAAVSTDGGRP
ncbi:thioesterase II family protein [Kitasatospora acidiphila]|uniref:thioesterase II family protein n=1 Tax=Kitasatospora acidiphila TaxID=2567942 RepID=UPI003C7242A2